MSSEYAPPSGSAFVLIERQSEMNNYRIMAEDGSRNVVVELQAESKDAAVEDFLKMFPQLVFRCVEEARTAVPAKATHAHRGLFQILRHTVLQDCCANHCRDWRETLGGLPASNHSPHCPNYHTELFYNVTRRGESGVGCVFDSLKEVEALRDDTCEEFNVSFIKMTRDQFEHMDEFEGW